MAAELAWRGVAVTRAIAVVLAASGFAAEATAGWGGMGRWLMRTGRSSADDMARPFGGPLADDVWRNWSQQLKRDADDHLALTRLRQNGLAQFDDDALRALSARPSSALDALSLRGEMAQRPAVEKAINAEASLGAATLPEAAVASGIETGVLVASRRDVAMQLVSMLLDDLPPTAFRDAGTLEGALKRHLQREAMRPEGAFAKFDVASGTLAVNRSFSIGPGAVAVEVSLGDIPVYKLALAAGAYMLVCDGTFCSPDLDAFVRRVIGMELRDRLRSLLVESPLREPAAGATTTPPAQSFGVPLR